MNAVAAEERARAAPSLWLTSCACREWRSSRVKTMSWAGEENGGQEGERNESNGNDGEVGTTRPS